MPALPDPHDRPTLTCDEVAGILGVGRSTVYRAVKSGDLPAITLGRTVRIPTAPLVRLLGLAPATEDPDADAPVPLRFIGEST
jgi:excisionase family DNA binding protein